MSNQRDYRHVSEDPLTGLLADKQELDRKALTDILAPYSRLDRNTGQIMLTPEFSKLANAGKIIVYLLSKKAAKNLSLPIEREEATPTEISDQTGINYDSVKPTVSSLAKKRVLAKAGKSYYVPDHAIHSIRQLIEAKANRGD